LNARALYGPRFRSEPHMAQIIDIIRHEDEIVAVLEYVEHDNLKACNQLL
jgi:hypothetical protein